MAGCWYQLLGRQFIFSSCGLSIHMTHILGHLHRVLLTKRMAWISLQHGSWVPGEQRQKLPLPLKPGPEVAQRRFFIYYFSIFVYLVFYWSIQVTRPSQLKGWREGCAGERSHLFMSGLERTYRK